MGIESFLDTTPRAYWRSGWDSNPRYLAVRLISSQVHSATLPPLLKGCIAWAKA